MQLQGPCERVAHMVPTWCIPGHASAVTIGAGGGRGDYRYVCFSPVGVREHTISYKNRAQPNPSIHSKAVFFKTNVSSFPTQHTTDYARSLWSGEERKTYK